LNSIKRIKNEVRDNKIMKLTTAEALYQKAGGKRSGLPAWTYNNAELTELEMEPVFLQNWIWVGNNSDTPAPRKYQSIDLATERYT